MLRYCVMWLICWGPRYNTFFPSLVFIVGKFIRTNACVPGSICWHCSVEFTVITVPPEVLSLDVCEKSRPHRDFFTVLHLFVSCTLLFWYWTWGRMLWIFPAGKIRRLRSGANPRTWVPKASMLTTRPPKPLIRSPDRSAHSQSLYRLSYPPIYML
jgi:hypothetical protein